MKFVFVKYCSIAGKRTRVAPVSFSTFFNYISSLRIWHQQERSICPHCEMVHTLLSKSLRDESEEQILVEKQAHLEKAKTQQQYLCDSRRATQPDSVYLVIDFSVIDYVTHHFNDLI